MIALQQAMVDLLDPLTLARKACFELQKRGCKQILCSSFPLILSNCFCI